MEQNYEIGKDIGTLQTELNVALNNIDNLQRQVNDLKAWILNHDKGNQSENKPPK